MNKYQILSEDLITVPQAQEILGLPHRSGVEKHMDKIGHIVIGGRRMLLKEDVDKLIAKQ